MLKEWADVYWKELFSNICIVIHNWFVWLDAKSYDFFLTIAMMFILTWYISQAKRFKQYFFMTLFGFMVYKIIAGALL
jgi:hypothetical protein